MIIDGRVKGSPTANSSLQPSALSIPQMALRAFSFKYEDIGQVLLIFKSPEYADM